MIEIIKTTVTERDREGKVTKQTETIVEKHIIQDYIPQTFPWTTTVPWTTTSGYSNISSTNIK